MPAERAHTFLATPSRMQNHRSKERRAAQRRLYSRLSTLKRRTSCGRGTPCVNTISEAIPSIMLRETPDDRRVAAPGLHLTHGFKHGRVTIVVVWKRFVKKMNLLRILYLQFFLNLRVNEIAVFSVYFRGRKMMKIFHLKMANGEFWRESKNACPASPSHPPLQQPTSP